MTREGCSHCFVLNKRSSSHPLCLEGQRQRGQLAACEAEPALGSAARLSVGILSPVASLRSRSTVHKLARTYRMWTTG